MKSSFKSFERTFKTMERMFKSTERTFKGFERKKYHLDGDKAEVYYTEVLRKFAPFPFFEGENYAFEGILWNRIANAGMKIRWFKDKLCQCEYLPDGMTAHFFEDCKKNYETIKFGKICPFCGSKYTYLLKGNETNIKEITVYYVKRIFLLKRRLLIFFPSDRARTQYSPY